VPGLDPNLAQEAPAAAAAIEDAGPLVATVRVEAKAPGARGATWRYRLAAGSDRLEVEFLLDKLPVRTKESAHLTFDLAVDEGRLLVDQGWNLMDPAKHALPGSCREFVGVHGAVDAGGPQGGVSVGLLDNPLVELESLVDERPNEAGIRRWRALPPRGTTVHAYLLNNYWHTNYKADQEGVLRFRFVLRPHGPEPAAAVSQLSRELEQPLLALPARGRTARPLLLLKADPSVEVVSLRPAGDGDALLVRLLNAGDAPASAAVGDAPPLTLAPWQTRLVRVP
jgi:hypothetical protein